MTQNRSVEFIDIGVNLTHDSFDADRDAVMKRAADVGVRQMIVTGATEDGSRKAGDLARTHSGRLFATTGVHPHHAADLTRQALAGLQAMASESQVVAVGECGLDYFRDFSPRDLQRRAFQWQLEIATSTGKPVFLHQRDAHDDFLAILREHMAGLAGGVAHCFTAGPMERDAYLELGLHIGITGWICDERRGTHLREVVKGIPADRILLETDAPYLLPRDLKPAPKSRRNEPHFLPHVAAAVAAARGESTETLARTATENTRRLFRLPS